MKLNCNDNKRICQALYTGIDWNESLIDAHLQSPYPPTAERPILPGYAGQVRRWKRQIKAWRKLLIRFKQQTTDPDRELLQAARAVLPHLRILVTAIQIEGPNDSYLQPEIQALAKAIRRLS